jgi:ABC-2 type transport system permease protein
MNKLWLIIKREYLTRVKKRSFILTTLLTPLAFGVFFIVIGFIFSYEGEKAKHIIVVDKGNTLKKTMKDDEGIYFAFSDHSLEQELSAFDKNKNDGIIVIPEMTNLNNKSITVQYYADDQLGIDVKLSIEKRIANRIRDYKIAALNLNEAQVASLDTKVSLDPEPITASGKNESVAAAGIAAGIGTFLGILMYMVVSIYGGMVMRGVMEEKTNRIVEVMISSVKPFELMLGKIIGIGAVGLTQFLVWVTLIPIISIGVNLLFGFDTSKMQQMQQAQNQVNPDDMRMMIGQFMNEIGNLNWWLIVPLIIIYFLGGYFIYASLFAAIGSAVGDDQGEAQSLVIPIMIPVLLAFYIMMVAVRQPHSNLAIWASVFPLFSPIVMPARLAFEPAWWEIALSLVTLIGSSIFFVWLSGRIYRVGIMLYGKKATFKELSKWIFYREGL